MKKSSKFVSRLVTFGVWILLSGGPVAFSAGAYPRPLPLREIAVEKIFRVTDFGAKPDDTNNDLPAIGAAFAAALQSGRPSEVRFSTGTYFLKPVSNDGNAMCLTLEGARDILIEGSGAALVVQAPDRGVFNISRSTNVVVRHFSVDYDPLPFSQGVITKINEGSIEVEIAEGFPSLMEPRFSSNTGSWGLLKDPAVPGRLKRGAYDWFATKSISDLGNRHFRIEQKRPDFKTQMEVGDRYVQNGRRNAAKTFGTGLSESVTFEGVTIYSSPGASYVGWFGSLINVIRCQTILKPGRWHSTAADGVHLQSQRIGPWIEGCVFEGIADDGVNIYTRVLPINEAGPSGFKAMGVPPNARPGDAFAFFSQQTGEAPVFLPFANLTENGTTFQFSENIPKGPPLTQAVAWQVYNTALAGNGFVIRSNVFKNSRRYGVLLKASHGLIEGNRFEGLSDSPITLRNIDQVEGLACEDVLIKGNLFTACGFDSEFLKSESQGLVAVGLYQKGSAVAPWQGQKNIRVTGNRFESGRFRAISIRSAQGVLIASNEFETGIGSQGQGAPPIYVSNASGISVVDNRGLVSRKWKDFVEMGGTAAGPTLSGNR